MRTRCRWMHKEGRGGEKIYFNQLVLNIERAYGSIWKILHNTLFLKYFLAGAAGFEPANAGERS